MKTYIVLFDGVCNLCNSTVQFILKKDKKDQFKFSSLQSDFGQNFLQERGLRQEKFDSVILYEPGRAYYTKSTATLKIAQTLGFPYNLLTFFTVFPAPVRDIVYGFIAKNRYKWFGKKESCMIPTPELNEKFLS
ncbi:MAG: DCC1-like thiol-disulfide oxidoreductase family protein [Flavobacteriaceae bacterium]|jgi:predicted DCC family thiol-disulfide oxidoreductase YuxK|nr:DCC1-like thiol-disulfide oxidoreductase family protein [Flavobacteriaceae bacterium]